MATQNRTTLKSYFNTDDRPTEAQFADLIDSSVNVTDDKATTSEAQAGNVDTKYTTPLKVKEAILQLAPVKTVNSKTPSAGNVALAIADIPNLQSGLDGKQATLVSGTTIKTINGNSLLGSGNLAILTPLELTTDSSSTGTTRSTVVAFNFAVAAGKKYLIQLLGEYQTAATSTGGSIGFLLTTAVGTIKGIVEIQGPSGPEKKIINAINMSASTANSFITSSGTSAANTPHYVVASLYFNCTTAGTFKIQWGSGVSGSNAVLKTGSTLVVTLLN